MNCTLARITAIAAVLLAGTSIANAAFVQWDIDQTVSKVTLAIPDQTVNLDGTTAMLRVRNQTGSSNTWNVGNSASVNGFLNSYYRETATSGVHDLKFTTNPLGQFVGLSSGNYRPNPARYDTAVTSTDNPDGTFTGSNASDFAAVFAGRMRPTVSLINIDLMYFNLFDTAFDLTSAPMLVTGTTGGSFNPVIGGVQTGILDSGIAVDGVTASIVGQPIPDSVGLFGSAIAALSSSATSTITDLGGQNRRLNFTYSTIVVKDLGGSPVTMVLSSVIVAYATVPEPSTRMLAAVGLLSLAVCARRRASRR